MNKQSSLWQNEQQSSNYAELCNALYERELRLLSALEQISIDSLQARIKSLPYYIKRTAHLMLQAQSPLSIDYQNATWSAKQGTKLPLTGQKTDDIVAWYSKYAAVPGLVVPIALHDRVVLDCIDRVDTSRFRTNVYGWFSSTEPDESKNVKLLKPNKKVLSAACAGHRWRENKKVTPVIPSLRELLLSCQINWQNFNQPNKI